jgi:PTH1 family peptidyl-tRNA hydrolase
MAFNLLVGLGNPGPSYSATRHNVGFWLLDSLADHFGGNFRSEGRFSGEMTTIRIADSELRLLKPMTFMNRSGESIAAVARFYRYPIDTLLVAHDDLDLDPGVCRFKRGGGHGGHNGLRDTSARLGSDYARLRIGIGHPGDRSLVHNHVLGRPDSMDRQAIVEVIGEIEASIGMLLRGDEDRAVQRLHARRNEGRRPGGDN